MQELYKIPGHALSPRSVVKTSHCRDFEAMVSANKSLGKEVCALKKELAVDEQELLNKGNEINLNYA